MPASSQPTLTLVEYADEYRRICLAVARKTSPRPILDAAMRELIAGAKHLCPQAAYAAALDGSIAGIREGARLSGSCPDRAEKAFLLSTFPTSQKATHA